MKTTNQPLHKVTLSFVLVAGFLLTATIPAQLRGADNTARPVIIISPPKPDTHPVRSTLLFQNRDGLLAAWSVLGTELSSANFLVPSQTGDPNWKVVGTGDFDGDKNADLLFQHDDGTLAVWFMKGTEMVQSSLLQPSQPGKAWRVTTIADLDRNGRPDLVFQHPDGSVAVWFMNGTRLALPALIKPSRPSDSEWRVVAAADFNDDGEPDLLFHHFDGRLGIWYVHGTLATIASSYMNDNPDGARGPMHIYGIVSGYEEIAYPVDAGWRVAGARDINGDRNTDLLFQHTDGFLAVWSMKGSILQSSAFFSPAQPGQGWQVVGVTDQSGVGLTAASGNSSSDQQR